MLIQLFHTEGCHLCALAEDVIAEAKSLTANKYALEVIKVDIALDDLLVEKYGVLIPVVKIEAVDHFLNWPFSCADIVYYLDQYQITMNFKQPKTELPTT